MLYSIRKSEIRTLERHVFQYRDMCNPALCDFSWTLVSTDIRAGLLYSKRETDPHPSRGRNTRTPPREAVAYLGALAPDPEVSRKIPSLVRSPQSKHSFIPPMRILLLLKFQLHFEFFVTNRHDFDSLRKHRGEILAAPVTYTHTNEELLYSQHMSQSTTICALHKSSFYTFYK